MRWNIWIPANLVGGNRLSVAACLPGALFDLLSIFLKLEISNYNCSVYYKKIFHILCSLKKVHLQSTFGVRFGFAGISWTCDFSSVKVTPLVAFGNVPVSCFDSAGFPNENIIHHPIHNEFQS